MTSKSANDMLVEVGVGRVVYGHRLVFCLLVSHWEYPDSHKACYTKRAANFFPFKIPLSCACLSQVNNDYFPWASIYYHLSCRPHC